MIKTTAAALGLATLALTVPAPSQAATAPAVIHQLTTHCVAGHCRQREVRTAPFVLGGTAVLWRHRDWAVVPSLLGPSGYGQWSHWQLRRVV